ncbi:phosphatase PAP2 family protein [Bradyrhizobium sp. LHD-71]|uniref:phosphatase PAP2 family protein n=1 Tax=Bradyrhizobium sp. LHD-71 TaxID=3072141 RepID=UPI00280DD58E|nr:phosphatase PAP2 family protein [Bradyrhizobium sp. LHD-71]MDQ8729640.1 phosphatase PAP2 family protein [Bradyrhizobium sp. LHD-71]
MNRAGLFIALSLSLAFVVLYLIFPELDLQIGGVFYDAVTRTFPLRSHLVALIARETAMIIAWAICMPALVALAVKLVRPDKPMLLRGRTVAYFVITMVLTAGIVTNLTFKSTWGRPRPASVVEFNGQWQFKHWWQPGGECPKNCSFFSGEASTAFWTYAPASLAPPAWRPLAYLGATVFGLATGGLRVAFGGHFVSDVLVAGLVTFLLIWLVHGLLYRWPSTRTTDERVEAVLAWVAWPGYAFIQRLLGREPAPRASSATSAVQAEQRMS